ETRRAGSGPGRGRSDQDRHFLGQPDPLLRLPTLHHGQRSPDRAQGGRRAAGYGRRPRSVHGGVSEALRGGRGSGGRGQGTVRDGGGAGGGGGGGRGR